MKHEVDSQDDPGIISRRRFLKRALMFVGSGAAVSLSPAAFASARSGAQITGNAGTDAAFPTAAPIERSMTQFIASGEQVPAYLARPVSDKRLPGVVVLHDWWGLDGRIQRVADRLAAAGFVALAPDLYHGRQAQDVQGVRQLVQATEANGVLLDAQAALDHLIAQDFVLPGKAGLVGLSFSDRLAIRLAQTGNHVGPTVVIYGGQIDPNDAAAAPDIYGEQSGLVTCQLLDQPSPARPGLFGPARQETLVLHAFFAHTPAVRRSTMAAAAWETATRWLNNHLLRQ